MGSLLVDRYRPQKLEDLSYHSELSARLKSLVATDFPHTLFYGPSGAGKKTRILCTLQELYGSSVTKLTITRRTFLTPSKKKVELNIVSSNFHIELTPSDAGIYDRIIISEILKEIASGQQIDLHAKKRFKVVIINEADLLSRDAQSALRRTMEKYTSSLRIILCANSTAKIIGPIRSRCLLLRVGAPTEKDITKVLVQVSKKASLALPIPVANLLANTSQGNLRRAILSLEALSISDPTFTLTTNEISKAEIDEKAVGIDLVPRPDWEKYSSSVVGRILGEQTPERLMEVRGMLYELLIHCISPSLILSTIAKGLLNRVSEDIKVEIIYWAGFYEHRLRLGSKAIFHLEAFIAKTMSLIKSHQMGMLEE